VVAASVATLMADRALRWGWAVRTTSGPVESTA
jgi:hypothetical protein